MKKLLRKLTSFAMALFMVLQVMLPAFATRSKAEEVEPNTIKNIEDYEVDDDSYLSITDSQKIYDKKKIDKDESKFSIAVGVSDTSSNFRLVKRNDLKLFDDGYFQTNEDASKEYWRIKDMLNLQGLDIDLEIIEEDQGYRILTKDDLEKLEKDQEDNFYGENYSYIDFKILDDFDFNEKGNQKLLDQEKLVFNLEFNQNISPDPNYNLFEKDEDGKWTVKNEGDIFAIVNADKVNVYDTSSLTNDLNSLESYKEEKIQAEEKAKKEAEEKKQVEEEKKAQEEKEKAERAEKAEEEKKAQEEKAQAEAKKAEEEKKAQEKSEAENKENQKEEKSVLETDKKENKDEKSSDQKSIIEKEQDKKPEEGLTMTNLEKADKELKEALKDENNSIGDIQKLLTELGEKYKLSRLDQEKLMSDNDKAIRDLVEKDREENFRPLNLRANEGFLDKKFRLKTTMHVKASTALPMPKGWYFDVNLGPYLREDYENPLKPLTDENGNVIARPSYNPQTHIIRYTIEERLTSDVDLPIDQLLAFDIDGIGDTDPIKINISVKPRGMAAQNMGEITVYSDDEKTEISSLTDFSPNIESPENVSSKVEYPVILEYHSHQTLRDKDGNEFVGGIVSNPQGLEAWWDIEVETDKLFPANKNLDFSKLYFTLFASEKQGLDKGEYKIANSQEELDDASGYTSMGSEGDLYEAHTDIDKDKLSHDKIYIRVKMPLKKGEYHSNYSLGLRVNPDNNYIQTLYNKFKAQYEAIPSIFKFIKGAEEAKKLGETPFNLVEEMFVAEFAHLGDPTVDENFYYDKTRTIVAEQDADYKKRNWIAMDLLRVGETEDYGLANANLTPNPLKYSKYYYIPKKDGGYRRTTNANDAILPNGSYKPGVIVYYDYKTQVGTQDTNFKLDVNLKDKPIDNSDVINNYEDIVTEGGQQNLYSRKYDPAELGYLAYQELPYYIMRINKTFEMVQCLNALRPDPTVNTRGKIGLDRIENPAGYLLNLNIEKDGINKHNIKGKLLPGGEYNRNGLSQDDAAEDLFKRIYFFAEEIKREYPQIQSHNNKEMHRMIENQMLQRVIHYFTDGKELTTDYSLVGTPTEDKDKFHKDITLTDPNLKDKTKYFTGTVNTDGEGHRKLSENEKLIFDESSLKGTQVKYAQELLTRVKNSYKNNDWEENKKANSVKLVYFTQDNKRWQNLISGHVVEPITAYKVDSDGNKLDGAEFTFVNVSTGEFVKATSTKDGVKVYLKEGTYRVRETKAPEGYEIIDPFTITVKNNEVNADEGDYPEINMNIRVNDGYKTKQKLDSVPKDIDGNPLVKQGKGKLEIEVVNISNKFGKLQFTKKDASKKLDGSEFTLTKITSQRNKTPVKGPDGKPVYKKTSKGDFGEFEFTKMPVGFYLLEETKVPDGYKKAKDQIVEVSLDQQTGKAVTRFLDKDIEASKVILNEAKTTELKLRKVDSEDEKVKLQNAKFRIYSERTIDNILYFEERTSGIDGIVSFEGLKEGEYILEELTAPSGYLLPKFLDEPDKFFGWKLYVKLADSGELVYDIYKLKTRDDAKKTEEQLKDSKINLDDVLKDGAVNVKNKIRTVNWEFKKYIENPDFDSSKEVDEKTNPKFIPLTDTTKLNNISFNLYEADYYGRIIDVDNPIKTKIKADKNGEFHLEGLKFNGYYKLREVNAPGGLIKASDITLKIEAETIANEGTMKVIVRDPSNDVIIGEHAIFKGVINFNEGAKLGKLAIKKTGISLWPKDNGKEVGLRRAFFRLYKANDNYDILLNEFGYPAEYTQKVTDGVALTDEKGNPIDSSKFPESQGIAVFDNIEPGKYVLEEYRGPAGYEKDPRPIYVLVDKYGNVFKSWDKNDPILNSTTVNRVRAAQTFENVTTPLRANATNNNDALTKEYDGRYAKIKIEAGPIDTEKATRHMKVTVTAKNEELDFTLGYNNYITPSKHAPSDYSGYQRLPSENRYKRLNLSPYSSFSIGFNAKLNDGYEGEYKKILNEISIETVNSKRTESFADAYEDFKIFKKSNKFTAKVAFEYHYYNYEGKGEIPVQEHGTGNIWLETLENGKWVKVKGTDKQAYKDSNLWGPGGIQEYKGLDGNKTYRIAYQLNKNYDLKNLWNWPSDTTYYSIDQSLADEDGNVLVKITNGNLIKIFNRDETGFRIPLRIEKSNEDKSPLSGAKFRAKKIVDGEKIEGKDEYPKYYDEPFDAVTEATGLAGENYFRELTPGIYEMWEEEAPNEYTKLKHKWYFKVEVDPEKTPRQENYMRMVFDFSYKFPIDLSDKKYSHLTEAEKNRLRGKTIFGLNSNEKTKFEDDRLTTDAYKEFIRNVQILKDNKLSKPARPDAPYKGIDVVGVTNHKSLGQLEFKKVALNNNPIEGATFRLTKVRVESNGKLIIKSTDKKPDPVIDDDGKIVYQEEITSKGILGIKFEGMTEGTYILEEIKAPEGYKKVDSFIVIKYKEDADGKLVQTVDKTQSDPDFLKLLTYKNGSEIESIKNEDNLTKLSFHKVNSKGEMVETSVFNLQAVDGEGNKKMVNGVPVYDETLERYADGRKYEFTGLKEGRYKLTETNYTIYAKPEPWYLNVVKDDNGNLVIKFENEKNDKTVNKNNDGSYNIVNYAKTNFRFTKVGQGLDSPPIPLSNIYFSLKRVRTDETVNGIKISYDENGDVTSITDKDGNELIKRNGKGTIQNPEILDYGYYNKTKTIGDGSINFANLRPGVYELEEITQHESFNTTTQRKWIIVVKKGSKGLEVSYNKEYEAEYYQKYEKDYYDKTYAPRNFKDSNLLTGNENEGFNVLNIRDKIDIKWRKVDSETGGVIHDEAPDRYGQPQTKNAKFRMYTNHLGIVAEDSEEFEKAWKVGSWSGKPDDPDAPTFVYNVEGTFGVYGLKPGVYAITEYNPPTGYKWIEGRLLIVLVTEKGKLKTTDPNYKENSNELVYKLFEVDSSYKDGKQVKKLINDPNDFKLIKVNEKNQIEYNEDGFFDFKNEPEDKKGRFEIEKKDSKNRPLAGAVFELADWQGVVRRVKADENGKVIFAGLTQEVYTLREAEPPTGYKKSDKVWKVFVFGNGHTIIREGESEEWPKDEAEDNYETPTLTVKNIPINPTGEFTISKVDEGNKPLQGASFKLEKTKDADGKDIKPTIEIGEKTSDDKGKILFEKLEPGIYELTETKAPDDYKKASDKWKITVDKDGNTTVVKTTANIIARSAQKFVNAINPDKITRAVGQEVPIKDIKVPNEKIIYGNFQIKKTDTDKTTILPGAEFTLTRVKDEQDNDVTGEEPIQVTSGTDGIAKFDKVKPGEYKLTETKAPAGYEMLTEEYTVKVTDEGGKVSVNIQEPTTEEKVITSTEIDSSETTLIFSSSNGYNYNEGKVKYTITKAKNFGDYWLGVEFTPIQNYSARRALTVVFDNENFDVYYNNTKLQANNAVLTLNTSNQVGKQTANFYLQAKDSTKNAEGNKEYRPVIQFSWAGKVRDYLQTNPNAYPKITINNETKTVEGKQVVLTAENSFEYILVNNKKKYNTEFSKEGKEVKEGKVVTAPLANAVFKLEKKNSEDNFVEIDRKFASDTDGKLVLNDLEAGDYKLYETNSPSGYRPIKGEAKEFRIDDNGNTFVKNKFDQYVPLDDTNKVIVNEKYGTESYAFIKRDGVTKEPLANVEFELLNSDGELVATQISDANGEVKFDDLQPGKYWIREKSQNEGYIKAKNPLKVIIGEQWKAPKGIEGKNVSSYFNLNPLKPSTLTSTTNSETVVYPNVQEGLFAKLNFSINEKVKPGDYFVMTLSDNVDLDGLSTIDDSEFDIYGPMGRVAIAKVREDRHVIDYTFTEAVDYYNDLRELTINTQMFVNRKLVQYNTDNLKVEIKIQDPNKELGNGAEFTDTINVNYDNETNNGYINAKENVKTYQLRLGTSSEDPRYFKNVIYVNPVRSKDGDKDLYFSANLPYTINENGLKVYKKTATNTNPKDLPWSFDIDHTKDNGYGLVDITNSVNWEWTSADTIHIDLGHGKASYNTDEYVIEINGVVNGTGEFKTKTEYNRRSPYFSHQMHKFTPNYDVIDYWNTWTKEYNPEAEGELAHELYNYKNRIEFTKLEAKTEKPLEGAKFELRKLGEDNKYTRVDGRDKTSDKDGKLVWEGLPEGKYQVWETQPLAGYKKPNKEVSSFEVNSDGSITNTSGNTTIVNEKQGMKFYIDKIWKDEDGKSNSITHGTLELKLTAKDGTFPEYVKVQEKIPEGEAYRIKEVSKDRTSITLEIDLSKAYKDVKIGEKTKEAIKLDVPGDWPQGNYSLEETKAPAGYNKTDKIFNLIVEHKKGTITQGDKILYQKGESVETINILEIENKRGVFPNTGGPGVWIGFTIIGLVIMFAGVLTYYKRKYRLVIE